MSTGGRLTIMFDRREEIYCFLCNALHTQNMLERRTPSLSPIMLWLLDTFYHQRQTMPPICWTEQRLSQLSAKPPKPEFGPYSLYRFKLMASFSLWSSRASSSILSIPRSFNALCQKGQEISSLSRQGPYGQALLVFLEKWQAFISSTRPSEIFCWSQFAK